MTTPTNNSQMHNHNMAAGSKERCLHRVAMNNGNHESPEDGDRPRVPSYTEKETYANAKPENKKLIDA
ncbi:hypothetical protein Tco_1474884 [Tanacetum coccineum]